jgi:hypothetical protein
MQEIANKGSVFHIRTQNALALQSAQELSTRKPPVRVLGQLFKDMLVAVIEAGLQDVELISKPGCPIVVYFVSGQPAWEGKTDGVSGADG